MKHKKHVLKSTYRRQHNMYNKKGTKKKETNKKKKQKKEL